ncbi:MAG: cysteine peptidase family C39 domain-containing protein [Synechococcales bacterium]|nr:cysteine peptidase family C39 domain-containing protein [Synechococcales bacterium]
MIAWAIATVLLGPVFFYGGTQLAQVMLRQGATANDLFKGREWLAITFVLCYLLLLLLVVNLPQLNVLPLEWRVSGMRVSWLLIRLLLLGACGVAIAISWKTARVQLTTISLVGILGLGGFAIAESHFLAPIHPELSNNLQPNGIFRQTSASSCAPAALATLLRRWGIEATESRAAELAETSRMGTSMPQLIQAIHSYGMAAIELKPTWQQMRRINRPAILSVWQRGPGYQLAHAVTLMAMTDEKAVIADPAIGKYVEWSKAEFYDLWREEYVPVFRPQDLELDNATTREHLKKLGYNSTPNTLSQAIAQFQADWQLKPTGVLDPKTKLLLLGKFLKQAPTLDPEQFTTDLMSQMNCLDRPHQCPW